MTGLDKAEKPMLYYNSVVGGSSPPTEQAAVAQSVVRRIGSAEVTGPIPVSSSLKAWRNLGFLIFVLHFKLYIFQGFSFCPA